MSLLLDALNKADQERKRNEASPGISSNHESYIDHRARKSSMLLIATIIISILILLTVFYWLNQHVSTNTQTVTSHSAATNTISTGNINKNANAISNKLINNNTNKVSHKPENNTAAQSTASVNTAQETENRLYEDNVDEESVADLYQKNAELPMRSVMNEQPSVEAITASSQTLDTAIDSSNTLANNSINNSISDSTNNSTNNQIAMVPTSITQFLNIPDLHDLPPQILNTIPSLNYTEHNYNTIGGNVKINGRLYHANDQLATGLVIDKILADGMILHIDNYSFKMKALNSWVNM